MAMSHKIQGKGKLFINGEYLGDAEMKIESQLTGEWPVDPEYELYYEMWTKLFEAQARLDEVIPYHDPVSHAKYTSARQEARRRFRK